MAKRKKKNHKKKQMTIPIAVVAGVAIPSGGVIDQFRYSWQDGTREAGRVFTGYDWYDNVWRFGDLCRGAIPIMAGIMVHKLAGRFGVNRLIAGSGIPLIRI